MRRRRRSTFHLSWLAAPDTIEVHVTDVDGDEVVPAEDPVEGWAYVGGANLVFYGAAVPPRGATIASRLEHIAIR